MPEDPSHSNPASASSRDSKPLRNHALWLGPVVTVFGVLSYFMYFAKYPTLRDFPWVNLPLTILGLGISVVGVRRVFTQADRYRGKIKGSLAFLFSLFFTGLFVAYVGYITYQLPAPNSTTQALDTAPSFSLKDQNGEVVNFSDFKEKRLILTFYRGYW